MKPQVRPAHAGRHLMTKQPVLIAGQWRQSHGNATFQSENPALKRPHDEIYPVSTWDDIHMALDAASVAAARLQRTPAEEIARFLELYAAAIESQGEMLVAMAHFETALAVKPRLAEVELPRTVGQLREAAARAARCKLAVTHDRYEVGDSLLARAAGAVLVLGPNNFPLAFNSVAGGDFAAAIAAANPVIAKANTSHPGTTRLLAVAADRAAREAGLPDATVQLLYREPRRRCPRRGRPAYRGHRLYRQPGGGLGAQSRGRPRRQTDLSGIVERESGRFAPRCDSLAR